MNDLNLSANTKKSEALLELNRSQLEEVTGGTTLGYGTSWGNYPPRPSPVMQVIFPWADTAPSGPGSPPVVIG
jgi:hypothetical protein